MKLLAFEQLQGATLRMRCALEMLSFMLPQNGKAYECQMIIRPVSAPSD